MTSPTSRTYIRLIVDPGVYVSAAISGRGAATQLIEAAVAGRVTLVVSSQLLAELDTVLRRPKFRRWLTIDDAESFLQAMALLAEHVEDPPAETRAKVCRDPKDDYLVALAEDAAVTFLVSGDRDLLELERGGLVVRTARATLDVLQYEHPWGPGLVPGDAQEAMRQAEVEGHDNVVRLAAAFLLLLDEGDVDDVLHAMVTPESLKTWLRELVEVRTLLAGRGLATRADYPAPDVAYVKLTLDPGGTVRATAQVPLANAVILTLQRRPELPDIADVGGWRVHAVGDYTLVENMPPATPQP